LKTLAIIDCSTYGWLEYVEHQPCQDAEEASRYYQRAGMLLCLTYVLGGAGCSSEYILAHGEHPVLLDPSILLHHYPCPDHQTEPFEKQCSDWEQQQFCVLHTGLLANWQMSMDTAQWGPGRDISGFALPATKPEHAPLGPRNSSLALKYGMLRARERLNVPMYDVNLLPPADCHAALCTGFIHMYRLLLNKRNTLLAANSPLQFLGQQAVRVIYRPEQAYYAHLAKLLEPEYMYDGVARGIELERLWSEHIPVEYKLWRAGNSARWRQVYHAEQHALLQGDIPFFTARADSDVLFADRAIASCLHQPSFTLLLQRVEQLSISDLRMQIALIQRALHIHVPSGFLNVTRDESVHDDPPQTLPSRALLFHAQALADTLTEHAIPLESGAVTWTQPQFLLHSYRQQLQPIHYSIFNGACGIALFLAAIAKISDESKYRTLARAAVKPLCQSLREDGEVLAGEMGIGGAVGLGSVVYALTRISRLLDDPAFLVAAAVQFSPIPSRDAAFSPPSQPGLANAAQTNPSRRARNEYCSLTRRVPRRHTSGTFPPLLATSESASKPPGVFTRILHSDTSTAGNDRTVGQC
jgi:type 2 lantibiotic biosynthesis protein LanM